MPNYFMLFLFCGLLVLNGVWAIVWTKSYKDVSYAFGKIHKSGLSWMQSDTYVRFGGWFSLFCACLVAGCELSGYNETAQQADARHEKYHISKADPMPIKSSNAPVSESAPTNVKEQGAGK